MKASEALALSKYSQELKDKLQTTMDCIYEGIKYNALNGLVAYHFVAQWLCSDSYDYKYLTQETIKSLEMNGYRVECKFSNPNQPWLLITWSQGD